MRRLHRFLFAFVSFAAFALAADVPRPAPEFAIQLTNGRQLLLSEFRGKVVVLEFMLTTCPHCAKSAQFLTRLQKEYGPRGYQSLGVAFNEMALMLVPDFIKENQVEFPIGVSTRDTVVNFLQHSAQLRFLVPQIVVIDRQGRIRAQTDAEHETSRLLEEGNIRAEVEKLLKEPVPASANPARKNRGK